MDMPFLFFKVKDSSMEPAIKERNYLFVSRFYRRLKEGDIVVLEHPRKDVKIVKRVKRVVADSVFVVGDNGARSEDSRSFGPIRRSSIVGKVLLVI